MRMVSVITLILQVRTLRPREIKCLAVGKCAVGKCGARFATLIRLALKSPHLLRVLCLIYNMSYWHCNCLVFQVFNA